MAVFGFHMVLTMVAATVFSKMSTRFSFADFFIFKGLYYYILEGSLVSRQENQSSNKRRRRNTQRELPEREDRLFRLPLTSNALEGVPFFDSLIWTVNYSFFALLVYIISDIYSLLFPQDKDLNTSLIWIICSLLLQIHVVMRIAFEKASSPQLFPERNILICALGLFFLGSMLLNIFVDKIIDMNFVQGYRKLIDALNSYVHTHGFEPLFSESARSPLLFLVCLSLLYSVIAASFFFPILQFTSLYLDSLEVSTRPKQILLHASFFSPAIITLLFLRPVVDHILEAEIITHHQLKALRIIAIILMACLRAALSKTCLQTFLDQPRKKLLEFRQEELKDEDKQRKVAFFASYSCTTTLQYYLPVIIILSTGLILKNLGNISFLSLFGLQSTVSDQPVDNVLKIIMAMDVHEPFWTLTLVTFLCAQFLISLIAIIGRRGFF